MSQSQREVGAYAKNRKYVKIITFLNMYVGGLAFNLSVSCVFILTSQYSYRLLSERNALKMYGPGKMATRQRKRKVEQYGVPVSKVVS